MSLLACQQPSFDSGFFGRSSVSLSVCLLTVCLAVCLFSHLLHRLTTSICPVSQHPLRSCSVLSLSLSVSPDPGLQCAVQQVRIGQRLRHLSDTGDPNGSGDVSDFAPSPGLRPSHGGTPQAHRPLRGTQSYCLLSPESRGGITRQKQSVKEKEKTKKKNITKGGTERRRTGDEEQVNWGMKKSILHWRVLKSKWQLLPVRMKSLVFTTLCQRRKPWMDTFSSYFVDLHLCIHEFRKPSLREGSRP